MVLLAASSAAGKANDAAGNYREWGRAIAMADVFSLKAARCGIRDTAWRAAVLQRANYQALVIGRANGRALDPAVRRRIDTALAEDRSGFERFFNTCLGIKSSTGILRRYDEAVLRGAPIPGR